MQLERAREALRLNNRLIWLLRFQIAHMYLLLLTWAVFVFADSQVIEYGCMAIAAAIIIHDRLAYREIKALNKKQREVLGKP